MDAATKADIISAARNSIATIDDTSIGKMSLHRVGGDSESEESVVVAVGSARRTPRRELLRVHMHGFHPLAERFAVFDALRLAFEPL